MDAIIGKYKVRIEETGLILIHPTGMSFDLTLEETVGLMEFIKSYRAAIAFAQRDTEPRIERVVADKESSSDTGECKLL